MSGSTALLTNLLKDYSQRLDQVVEAQKALAPLGDTGAQLVDMRAKIDEVLSIVADNNRRTIAMSAEMDALVAQVKETNDAANSAVTLIRGLRQQIIDAGTDPAKLKELTDSLKASEDPLTEAVATPGTQPPPPPAP